MTRSSADWTRIHCECGADIAFRNHWAGLVEVVCGECRVMLSYSGRERLANLPQDSLIPLLRHLLEVARTEQRNRESAEVLCGYLEGRVHQDTREPVAVTPVARRHGA
ncbi:MAG TPA: hypothetical protein VJQ52_15205 [Steroidobacteraceae bacterium]|nr:hypothetical protein [Steroidobacteraceae bacterium]